MHLLLAAAHVYYLLRALLWAWLWTRAERSRLTSAPPVPAGVPQLRYAVVSCLYDEAAAVPQLLVNLSRLEYPAHLLRFYIAVEESDSATRAALAAVRPLPNMTIVTVPDPEQGESRTKPRALNFALETVLADGADLLVIYDAEDQPDVDQLVKAEAAFRRGPAKLGALQARLAYWNGSDSWLARMFQAEYMMWFGYLIRGLCAVGMPVPLGGTSNHLRIEALQEMEGWDPENVTEDCELGLRLSASGWRIDFLDSTTLEEACFQVGPWIRQRTRWSKGYMWTWWTSRAPGGWRGQLTWHLFVLGTPLVALFNPMFWVITALWLVGYDVSWLFPTRIEQVLAVATCVIANGISVLLPARAFWADGHRRHAVSCLMMPLYWFLHSIAAYRGVYQNFTKRTVWEKTPHAVSPSLGGKQ